MLASKADGNSPLDLQFCDHVADPENTLQVSKCLGQSCVVRRSCAQDRLASLLATAFVFRPSKTVSASLWRIATRLLRTLPPDCGIGLKIWHIAVLARPVQRADSSERGPPHSPICEPRRLLSFVMLIVALTMRFDRTHVGSKPDAPWPHFFINEEKT